MLRRILPLCHLAKQILQPSSLKRTWMMLMRSSAMRRREKEEEKSYPQSFQTVETYMRNIIIESRSITMGPRFRISRAKLIKT